MAHSQPTASAQPDGKVVARGPGRAFGGPVAVLLAASLWGTTGTAATFAPPDASSVSIGAATLGFGGLVLLLLAGRSAVPPLRGNRAVRVTVLLGALAIAIYPLAFYSSMNMAGVAVGTVVSIGSAPVFAALFEFLVDRRLLARRWFVATAVSASGIVLLALGGHGGASAAPTGTIVVGVGLGLVAGATYAGYSYAARRLIERGYPSRGVMGLLFGLSAVVLVPIFVVTGGPLLSTSDGIAVAVYLAVIPMSLAYVLFGTGLRRVDASTATTLSLIEPVVAAVLALVVVGERLGPGAWIGAGMIGLGLVLLVIRPPSGDPGPAV